MYTIVSICIKLSSEITIIKHKKSKIPTPGEADAVALGVQLLAHLHEVTVPGRPILHRGGLSQVSVLALHHPSLALIGGLHEHGGCGGPHSVVHLLIQSGFRFLAV